MITTKPEVKPTDKFTVGQVEKLLEISRQTIYRHVADNKLVPIDQKKPNPVKSKEKRLRKYFSGKEIIRYWQDN